MREIDPSSILESGMPREPKAEQEHLAVVSEWSSFNARGGLLGNAYPIYSYDSNAVVTQPEDVFYNPGYIFLLGRGTLAAWDFVRVHPAPNDRYQDRERRECGYLSHDVPELIIRPEDQGDVATILQIPDFHPIQTSQLQSPGQNVTPLFFVQNRAGTIYGPLLRQKVLRSAQETIDAITWTCPEDSGLLGEFTIDELASQHVQQFDYSHPDPTLNEIIARPIKLLVGPVHRVTATRVHDRVADDQLVAWLTRSGAIPTGPLRDFFAKLSEPVSAIGGLSQDRLRDRLCRLQRILPKLELLADERKRIATEFMGTEEGKRALESRIELEIQRRSEELQKAVRKQESEAAARESALNAQLQEKVEHSRRELDSLYKAIETRTQQKAELDATLIALQGDLNKSTQALADKVRQGIPIIAALTSGLGSARVISPDESAASQRAAEAWTRVVPIEPSRPLEHNQTENQLLDTLAITIRNAGLSVTRDFLTNLYVSMKASPLNLVAGPPGHGKSTLIATLATALGHGNAFLEIAVRRSWSDDRHLLGFFDSFHGCFDPGPTGLAGRLLQAERDWEDKRVGIYFILLDEFNLAAPEYYFSQLMQIVPRDSDHRSIRLYDPARHTGTDSVYELKLHPNVRFWGTINYDETTERLSPRMLDRTGMVFLTPRDVLQAQSDTEDRDVPLPPGVDAKRIFGDFVRPPECCSDECWELIEPVLALIKKHSDDLGTGLPISPRCRRMVRSYLSNSQGLLEPAAAADFAVQQLLLPGLRGRGDQFVARVKALGELMTTCGFERSARHIQESLTAAAAHFGDIDFFVY
jgi:energy-coupling factor transporter ATP-binding protein EcfA2